MAHVRGVCKKMGREHTEHIMSILKGCMDTLPAITAPTRVMATEMTAHNLLHIIYLEDRNMAVRKQEKLDFEIDELHNELCEQCSQELNTIMKKGKMDFSRQKWSITH